MKIPMNGHGKSIIIGPSAQQLGTSQDRSHEETEQRLRANAAELTKAHEELIRESSKLARAEQALHDSDRRLNAILDTSRSIIAEREDAEESLRKISGRLARSSDADRRIARDLHDTTSPALAGVIARLYVIRNQAGKLDAEGSAALTDSLALAEHVAGEIRTLSERLELPTLDDANLATAIRSFAREFEKESGVRVELTLAAELGRLPAGLENTLFRIVKEVLPELQRNSSGGRPVEIHLSSTGQEYTLEVRHKSRDTAEVSGDVGTARSRLAIRLAGPIDRIRGLGGDLTISTTPGLVVRAVVPMQADSTR